MSDTALPDCGLYRTTTEIGPIPAGRLVYFHNHGDPGPGVYPPEAWNNNRARFSKKGVTLPDAATASTLEPLPPEGFYNVREPFFCCDKECRTFEQGLLVQLGYNGEGRPILFVPEWTEQGLSLPQMGQGIDLDRISNLDLLKVKTSQAPETAAPGHDPGHMVH